MQKINHSKYKNAGFLFEILTRQVTADTINGVSELKSLELIKKYFNKNTELYKEYALYDAVIKNKFASEVRAQNFVDKIIGLRHKLSPDKLKREKYNLVKEIKADYDLKEMFSAQLNEYKVYSSLYILFECSLLGESYDVNQYSMSNDTVVDFLLRKESAPFKDNSISDKLVNEDKEVRLLAYRLMIDKFNKKYRGLSDKQKTLLREYINNVSNTNSLREYINEEADIIKNTLNTHVEKTSSEVTKIKLTEIIDMIELIKKGTNVKDNQLKSLLYYYDLAEELNRVNA
jgi:hypothetical protein